ncbi:hypothetical protein [Candidatus Hakubella thermalkaliphila]|nr:hypothetical protein [Candidatus Hakubella thermalkaliphila]
MTQFVPIRVFIKNSIGVTAKRSKFVYLALSGESKSDGKLAQNLVFAVTPVFLPGFFPSGILIRLVGLQ